MMRVGSRTMLSMRNNYEDPPESFALVVPVPVVLQEDNVKILEDAVFDRVDQLATPRLVEHWETDPCWQPPPETDEEVVLAMEGGAAPPGEVRIEAHFSVGEYDVVILSADESTALDTWLRANDYQIPEGAEPVLRPYVQAGMKFFVAKVNVDRVTFEKAADGP